jgi:Bacterial Ig-like domain
LGIWLIGSSAHNETSIQLELRMMNRVSDHWADRCRLAVSCVLFLIAGCGGGGAEPILGIPTGTSVTAPPPAPPNVAAPTVTSTTPIDQDELVCPDSDVQAIFSEPMDAATINTSTFLITFKLAGVDTLTDGVVTYNDSLRTASFRPTGGNLLNGTEYIATLKSGVNGVKNVAGVAMQADFVWAFRTRSIICR